MPPECKRPGCGKPVPRDADGRWFACCSPFCAIEMGEDIPAGTPDAGADAGEPGPLSQKQIDEAHDRGQVIMSARVCGTLLLLPAVYVLVTGQKVELTWELLFPVVGLALFVFGFAAKLPKIPPKAEPPDRTPDSRA